MTRSIFRALLTVGWVAIDLVTCFGPKAQAGEQVNLAGPIGGTDIRSALLPPPGLYGGFASFYAQGQHLYGPGTQEMFPDFESSGSVLGAALLYVYDKEIFGGHIASSVFVRGDYDCVRLVKDNRSCATGLGDPFVDALIWSRFFPSAAFYEQHITGGPPIPFGLTITPALSGFIPLGDYDKDRLANPGVNHWVLAPNLALTYTMKGLLGDATELSARIFYNAQFKNHATDYLSGDLINIDFAISERFGALQVGLAGTGYQQITDDVQYGRRVYPDGKRAEGLQLGPVIAYDFAVDGRPCTVSAKALFAAYGENTVGANTYILRFGTKLY